MNMKRVHFIFKTFFSEANSKLKSHASLFCADRGYYIDDLALFFDDTELLPGVSVALLPALNYDKQALKELELALEDDINNIIFNYAYNTRQIIGAEDSITVMSTPHISERMSQLVITSQN